MCHMSLLPPELRNTTVVHCVDGEWMIFQTEDEL